MFGQKLGMKKILIGKNHENFDLDGVFNSLFDFSKQLIS
jgi:hypothetical protein